jgi:hypothetical protein
MKILCCGGRNLKDEALVFRVLDDVNDGTGPDAPRRLITCVVTGAASGADYLAEKWAKKREVSYRGHPAPWHHHGPWCRCDVRHEVIVQVGQPNIHQPVLPAICKAAGMWRNGEMLKREHTRGWPIGLCVAFDGGAGTASMVRLCREAGIEVLEVAP